MDGIGLSNSNRERNDISRVSIETRVFNLRHARSFLSSPFFFFFFSYTYVYLLDISLLCIYPIRFRNFSTLLRVFVFFHVVGFHPSSQRIWKLALTRPCAGYTRSFEHLAGNPFTRLTKRASRNFLWLVWALYIHRRWNFSAALLPQKWPSLMAKREKLIFWFKPDLYLLSFLFFFFFCRSWYFIASSKQDKRIISHEEFLQKD